MVIGLPTRIDDGWFDGGHFVGFGVRIDGGVVIVLVKIAEVQSDESGAKFLASELLGGRTLEPLEEEALDIGSGWIGGKKDLDDSAFAGDIYSVDDADLG